MGFHAQGNARRTRAGLTFRDQRHVVGKLKNVAAHVRIDQPGANLKGEVQLPHKSLPVCRGRVPGGDHLGDADQSPAGMGVANERGGLQLFGEVKFRTLEAVRDHAIKKGVE